MAIACQEATVYATHDATLREFLDASKATFAFTCPTARVEGGSVIYMRKFKIGEANLERAMWDLLRDFEQPATVDLIDTSCSHYVAARFTFTGGFVADGQFDDYFDAAVRNAADAAKSGDAAVSTLARLRIVTDGVVENVPRHAFDTGLRSGQFDDLL